jgi:hypothetical protein
VAAIASGSFASQLRQELAARNREWARGRRHVESLGSDPVIVYTPEEDLHGNFFDPAFAAIQTRPEWARRFNKVHAQRRALPRPIDNPARKWRELDSCMSSDALLMNVFCTPGVVESPAVRNMLGVDTKDEPVFGWKARVPLKSGLFDRTEVDMSWGSLLVEAKLTETDFQDRKAEIVESYRDFDGIFAREELPQVEVVTARRRHAVEFAEVFTQEWEETGEFAAEETNAIAAEFQSGLVAQAEALAPREIRYQGYQLIRNVLAAHAHDASFCVIHDDRRPDLREAWFSVLRAVRSAQMRTRLKVLTWQELARALPGHLQAFLLAKYGVVSA